MFGEDCNNGQFSPILNPGRKGLFIQNPGTLKSDDKYNDSKTAGSYRVALKGRSEDTEDS
jgi:hypothetical protein